MMVHLSEFIPGIPPLSMVTVAGACVMIACLVLYLLSRVREFLLVSAIAGLYAAVPMISMMMSMYRHF